MQHLCDSDTRTHLHPHPHTHRHTNTSACTPKRAHAAACKCSARGREDEESGVEGMIKTDEKRRWRMREEGEEEVEVVEGEQGGRKNMWEEDFQV